MTDGTDATRTTPDPDDHVARLQAEIDARAGILVDRDFAPAAAARALTDPDPADHFDRRHFVDEARLGM